MKDRILKKNELLQILYALTSVYDTVTANGLIEKIIMLSKLDYAFSKVVPLSAPTHPEHLQTSEG